MVRDFGENTLQCPGLDTTHQHLKGVYTPTFQSDNLAFLGLSLLEGHKWVSILSKIFAFTLNLPEK